MRYQERTVRCKVGGKTRLGGEQLGGSGREEVLAGVAPVSKRKRGRLGKIKRILTQRSGVVGIEKMQFVKYTFCVRYWAGSEEGRKRESHDQAPSLKLAKKKTTAYDR